MSLMEKVIEQIKQDVEHGELSAIEELLREVPEECLKGFLEED